ncbi:MAG: DinB family protein [Gemmatimonadota bacterium]|nr:DinB family protein [Gemmatimonadota bacterium]
MSAMESFLSEIEMEAPATRAMLERVPAENLEWRPHEKSMTLGELALHVAGTPGEVAGLLHLDEIPPPDFGSNPQPRSVQEILDAYEESLAAAKRTLAAMDDEEAMKPFRVVDDGRELMSMPKVAVVRAILLNHWYHHRGQLSVYLRLLEVPVPATYGASADENPMAG